MKVAVRLRRVEVGRPACAVLVPGHDAQAALAICAAMGTEQAPLIFAVADGLLLYWKGQIEAVSVGAIRLGEIGPNLLLPVDAEIVPGFLDDEAAALGRERGFVFLPHGRVLEFDPERPLPWQQLLEVSWAR